MLYANGFGVERDLGEAAAWYRRAARHGHDGAQLALGLMYLSGQGIERDPAEAAALLRDASERGNSRARYNLGLLYFRGDGVNRTSLRRRPASGRRRARVMHRRC